MVGILALPVVAILTPDLGPRWPVSYEVPGETSAPMTSAAILTRSSVEEVSVPDRFDARQGLSKYPADGRVTGRRLEIFLDYVVSQLITGVKHVLNPKYRDMLTPGDCFSNSLS